MWIKCCRAQGGTLINLRYIKSIVAQSMGDGSAEVRALGGFVPVYTIVQTKNLEDAIKFRDNLYEELKNVDKRYGKITC